MRKSSRPTREQIRSEVCPVAARYAEIAAIYLFGSYLADFRPESDIDLGVILKPSHQSKRNRDAVADRLAMDLVPSGSHPYDIVAADPADYLFSFRILREGYQLCVFDCDALTDTIEQVALNRHMHYYRYRLAEMEVLAEVGRHRD